MRRTVLLVLAVALAASGCGARAVAPSALRPTLPRTVAVLAGAAHLGPHVGPAAPALHRQVVSWWQDGVRREYVEVAPATALSLTAGLPLVVVLHGRRQTPARAERSQGWDAIAARDHVLVAYGAGYGGSWNAGRCCGVAAARHLDDVAYVLQVLRRAEARHRVDRRRVYLVGFSNGGMLAYRFACRHAADISALAVVAGALEVPACRPLRPLAVLAVHGGRDRIVPFAGTAYSRVAGARTASVPVTLAPWRRVDAGTPEPVQLVRLARLGHDWPTRRDCGLDGTGAIWRFLAAHPAVAA